MATRYTDEFRRDAVRIAVTSGLTRPQVSSDLGVGLSTLNKWVQKHPLPGRVLRSNIPRGSMMI
jgi:transposase-like protein